jgi:hypothetical protein
MIVAALSTARISQQIPPTNSLTKSQQAWQTLQQSLASGNLAAAQTAFSSYQQTGQISAPADANSPSNSQATMSVTALGNALSSGDLSGARTALAQAQVSMMSTPEQAVADPVAAVSQAAQRVDDMLSLSDSSSFSPTPADPTTAIEDGSFGVNTSPNIADPATAVLNAPNGADTTPGESFASASGNGAIESSMSSRSSASVNTYA